MVKITPFRYIPFDIGYNIDFPIIEAVNKKLNFKLLKKNIITDALTSHIVCLLEIKDDLRLAIFDYGIGVFILKEKTINYDSDSYSIDYCKERKITHNDILKFNHRYSDIIKLVMECFRNIYNEKRRRFSSYNNWEHSGLSYVMTSTFIEKEGSFLYEDMNDLDKKSIQILLMPSLASQEDSIIFNEFFKEYSSINNIDLSKLDIIHSLNNKLGIYVSWAAVILVQNKIYENDFVLINGLEVNLQAMWMYIYSLRSSTNKNYYTRSASELKREELEFEKIYNEFRSINDSSLPDYVSKIYNEMIITSGVLEEVEKYKSNISSMIEYKELIRNESRKKYSWISESLLFLIAYIDISNTIYSEFIKGSVAQNQKIFFILCFIILITSIVLIIKKE